MKIISSSDGMCLRFPDNKLCDEYHDEELKLQMKYYGKIRRKYGIFASNQGKFVNSISDFNSFDSMYMEDKYEKYVKSVDAAFRLSRESH